MTTHHPKFCIHTALQLVGLTTEKSLPTALPYDFQSISCLGMGDNKNFMSQYIVRVTIAIINIIAISLNSIIATKIVKIRWMHFTDVHVSEEWIL